MNLPEQHCPRGGGQNAADHHPHHHRWKPRQVVSTEFGNPDNNDHFAAETADHCSNRDGHQTQADQSSRGGSEQAGKAYLGDGGDGDTPELAPRYRQQVGNEARRTLGRVARGLISGEAEFNLRLHFFDPHENRTCDLGPRQTCRKVPQANRRMKKENLYEAHSPIENKWFQYH